MTAMPRRRHVIALALLGLTVEAAAQPDPSAPPPPPPTAAKPAPTAPDPASTATADPPLAELDPEDENPLEPRKTYRRIPTALEVSLETSPVLPILRGASFTARAVHPGFPNLAVAADIRAFSYPHFFVNQFPDNQYKGWHVRARPSLHLIGDYYLRPNATGFALGLATGITRFQIDSDIYGGWQDFYTWSAIPRTSYTWFLTDDLYLTATVSLEVYAEVAGSSMIGDAGKFHMPRIQPMGGIQLGYVVLQ